MQFGLFGSDTVLVVLSEYDEAWLLPEMCIGYSGRSGEITNHKQEVLGLYCRYFSRSTVLWMFFHAI